MAVNSPETNRARIHRVRITTSDAVQEVRPFAPDECYVITDRHPYLEFEVEGPPLIAAKTERQFPSFERVPAPTGIYWQKWLLGGQLSHDRRMGRFELPLQAPTGVVLQCYVVPEKLLGVADLWAMSEDVEREIDRPAAWDSSPSSRVRSWIQEGRATRSPSTASLLTAVRHELTSARALRRDPPCEPGRRGRALVRVPEVALVSQWAIRRGAALARAEERMAAQQLELRRRTTEHGPQTRIASHILALAQCEQLLDELRVLRPQVMHLVDNDELRTPVPFGPLLQRDHRLRSLLVAFSPPASEIVSERVSLWSRYPPVSLNDLFECWGAVWVVNQLRSQGFTGQTDLALGSETLDGCTWTLRRGDVVIHVDYEPHPAQLDFTELPPLDERAVPAAEWAIARQYTGHERPLFGSEMRCSPDYVLRMQGPRGAAMAIGDACLADPAYHQEKDAKAHVLHGYRRTILWRAGDRVVRCDPHGAFVLLPGPATGWVELEARTRALDVWHFYPQPRTTAPNCMRFTRFIERLIAQVT